MVRIREGIAEALRDGSAIDHETACLIARAITPGGGALHQFAMTGEITRTLVATLRSRTEYYLSSLTLGSLRSMATASGGETRVRFRGGRGRGNVTRVSTFVTFSSLRNQLTYR